MKKTKRTLKIICLTLVLIGIYLTSSSNLLAQRGSRYNGEIMCEVKNLEGEDEEWIVTAECLSTYRWWYVNDACYLTTGYSFASVSGKGNHYGYDGFQSPHSPDYQHDLAWAEYEFTFDMPDGYSDKSFTLDLRDADWSGNYDPPDIYIRYDVDSGVLDRKIGEGGTYSSLNEDSIWEIYGISQPNQEAFQPTEPRNFTCTNPTETKAHPNFTWEQPAWPYGARTMTVYYKIFRNNREVDNNITTCSWTDPDVVIMPGGDELTYYAKAYLAHSPDSDPSNSASINGSLAKQLTEQQFPTDKDEQLTDKVNLISLSAYPNPFNPTTTISFNIPSEGLVRIDIYNITGQRIADIVNERKSAGIYHLHFNGQALAGGIYLVVRF